MESKGPRGHIKRGESEGKRRGVNISGGGYGDSTPNGEMVADPQPKKKSGCRKERSCSH